ncbi:DHHA2 domain-containing protein [Scandinavium sp. M-37]|uniref:DHHA2 domain-containing protein n=1 Tax=Scandinavium sp. M-37 TaxID=3373077 RepID=UPI00374614D9
MKTQHPVPAESESMIYVFGHRNPDSDSICSARVVADWLTYTARPATPFRLGELTPETRYILDAAGVSPPALLTENLTDKKVWLVDFSDAEQGPPTLLDSDIIGIIDHHRIGTVVTRNPPDVWVRAVGCSATVILAILTRESPMPLSASQATLLLGAILSDTVALTGPTTTAQDRQAVAFLRDIVEVDYQSFVDGLLAAKTDLSGQSASQLLHRDAKNYQLHGLSILLSQIEVAALSDIDPHLPGLLQEIDHARQQSSLDIVVLILTDITQHNSVLYFSDNKVIGSCQVPLPGMTSRKKEILPWLTERLALTKD